MVSGGTLPDYYLAYVDYYGQIVGSDYNSNVRLTIDAEYMKNNETAQKYTPMIEGDTNYIASSGVIKISGVKFTGTPGSTYKISFQGTGIDEGLPGNIQY